MQIVFHGTAATMFREGIEAELEGPHSIAVLPEVLAEAEVRTLFGEAEVIVGTTLRADMPSPAALRLYHSPGAGYNNVALDCLPAGARLCNCYGHEQGIAEYVLAVLLRHFVPLEQADADLRTGRWRFGGPQPKALRAELASATLGILGYGHIGRRLAALAKAVGMQVNALTRTPASVDSNVDEVFPQHRLHDFMASADAIVLAVPLDDHTRGMIDASALAAMRPEALLINVARGEIVDELALFAALKNRSIAGAAIDTWYVYPNAGRPETLPGHQPFEQLGNLVMTPHMSGWTRQLIGRRRGTIADNINRLARGDALVNVVHEAAPSRSPAKD